MAHLAIAQAYASHQGNTMTPPPRLICFDWGGVILRICRSWEEGCAAAGLPVRPGSETPEARALRREWAARYQIGALTCDEFFVGASQAIDGLYTPDEIRRIHDAWLIAEYPGVADIIETLASKPDVETGLLSNTNQRHWLRHLPRSRGDRPDFPAIGMLGHRHASHILGCAKPGIAIYQAFEQATGAAPHEILFFDDLQENVLSARACGWRAEQIDHTGDTAEQIRQYLFSHGVW
ncbi:MAG: HAD-IA family hydrolase [Phycisphaeraceae bacterium]|nr:HAD-IA family hydrolase [Phycisphaeraceae bacterium]MCW5753419.1 HAD-IA family hydrolase [Phycisphaeraceae bacterium]